MGIFKQSTEAVRAEQDIVGVGQRVRAQMHCCQIEYAGKTMRQHRLVQSELMVCGIMFLERKKIGIRQDKEHLKGALRVILIRGGHHCPYMKLLPKST